MNDDEERTAYWTAYYEPLHASAGPRLDASSPAMWHAYAVLALGRTGPLLGRTLLDAGCGAGALVHAARSLGAAKATGFDVVGEAIKQMEADTTDEHTHFLVGDLADPTTWPDGEFAAVTCIEAAHFVPDPMELAWSLWDRVRPGGRLVMTFADARSPYNGKVAEWHEGRYASIDPQALGYAGDALGSTAWTRLEALSIAGDQRMSPFAIGPVTARPAHRLVLTVARA
jgi:SAM-dependent methyltransferase